MKKEVLISCVITIDKNGYDKCYSGEYCSQFKTVRDLYYHFYELIREDKIERFVVLDSFPAIYVNHQAGNIVKEGVSMGTDHENFLVKTNKDSEGYLEL